MRLKRFFILLLPFTLLLGLLAIAQPARACGGLFCLANPIDQNAERIIFTDNGDGTISAIIQIQYTGFDIDFSWILPIPVPIEADAVEVPETAVTAFTELETMTNPQFIPPPLPDCALDEMVVMSEAAEDGGGVEVFSEGEVGPYQFVVVGSEDPDALVNWLRDNQYVVEDPMIPLINVYVEEDFVFMAMRLQPEFGVQDIQPIKVTYPSENPMIPLRLTAVAANPDMAVLTWFFAEQQAVPDNYGHFEIDDDEITFFTFGGHNYRTLMGEKADEMNGQAFITEYAAPTSELAFSDPLLQELSSKHSYLTRLNTVISPEEMTIDPVFRYEDRPNVFNIHDLSNTRGQYDCEREAGGGILTTLFGNNSSSATDDDDDGGRPATNQQDEGFNNGLLVGLGGAALVGGLVGAGILIGRRSRKSES
ncbi:DUF2330 domain-containing protein [Candidatus Leptofilum sp.]|uniref:DUF2330 domain-containing protein n=1 Tax=Candidatus Leptofilum sp. TaxID=3241576 RepID=UPI003B5A1B68